MSKGSRPRPPSRQPLDCATAGHCYVGKDCLRCGAPTPTEETPDDE